MDRKKPTPRQIDALLNLAEVDPIPFITGGWIGNDYVRLGSRKRPHEASLRALEKAGLLRCVTMVEHRAPPAHADCVHLCMLTEDGRRVASEWGARGEGRQ